MDFGAIRGNFEKHGFSTQCFATKEEARDYLVGELKLRSIGFGGSVTLDEMGLYEALSENNAVVWHNKINSREVRKFENQAAIYITSANAVTETGEIVNVDGTGNRVAMTAFGPEVCYYVVGKNKITQSVTDAIYRSRNVAAPKNAQRVGAKTPCAARGDKCYDCDSPDRICNVTIIIDRAPKGMRSEIIFIDEALGY